MIAHGFRDAPAAWQDMLAEILVEQGFVRGRYEPSIYMHPTKQLTLVVHVDDFHLTGPDEEMLKLMAVLEKVLVIKHQGPFGPGDSYTFLRATRYVTKEAVHVVPDTIYIGVVEGSGDDRRQGGIYSGSKVC